MMSIINKQKRYHRNTLSLPRAKVQELHGAVMLKVRVKVQTSWHWFTKNSGKGIGVSGQDKRMDNNTPWSHTQALITRTDINLNLTTHKIFVSQVASRNAEILGEALSQFTQTARKNKHTDKTHIWTHFWEFLKTKKYVPVNLHDYAQNVQKSLEHKVKM